MIKADAPSELFSIVSQYRPQLERGHYDSRVAVSKMHAERRVASSSDTQQETARTPVTSLADQGKASRKRKRSTVTNPTDKPKARRKEAASVVSFKRKNCTSKYKGVLFVKSQHKWRAQICFQGKKEYIGSFDNEDQAALARDKRIRELFGDRPELLNFPNVNVYEPVIHQVHEQARAGYEMQTRTPYSPRIDSLSRESADPYAEFTLPLHTRQAAYAPLYSLGYPGAGQSGYSPHIRHESPEFRGVMASSHGENSYLHDIPFIDERKGLPQFGMGNWQVFGNESRPRLDQEGFAPGYVNAAQTDTSPRTQNTGERDEYDMYYSDPNSSSGGPRSSF